MARNLSPEMQRCVDDCLETHGICLETVSHCLQMGGKHAEVQHIRLMLDCAQICQTNVDFMLRSSTFCGPTCSLCADVCTQCAEDCEQFRDDDQMMTCAQVSRRCASSCQTVARMV